MTIDFTKLAEVARAAVLQNLTLAETAFVIEHEYKHQLEAQKSKAFNPAMDMAVNSDLWAGNF